MSDELQFLPFMLSQPHPIVTKVGTATLNDDGHEMVLVMIETPEGSRRHFLSKDHALSLAAELTQAANNLNAKIVTPPKPRLVVPNGG